MTSPVNRGRILYFTRHGNLAPSTRYRIAQIVPHLERLGFEVEVQHFAPGALYHTYISPGRLMRKLAIFPILAVRLFLRLVRAGSYDLVVVHKDLFPYGPLLFEHLLFRINPAVVYELDDAVFLKSPMLRHCYNKLRKHDKAEFLMAGSRAVIAGNAYIAEHVSRFNPRVQIVPTVVDLSRYNCMKLHEDRRRVVVGWAGTRGNLSNFDIVREALVTIQAEVPEMVLEIFSDDNLAIPGVNVVNRAWTLESEIEGLLNFDIGIMPLFDDPWTRGKCGFKIIQYMAVGLPTVCSPVGANREIVMHGKEGFFAETPDEWRGRLGELIRNWRLRADMGRQARGSIEQQYTVEAVLPTLVGVFEEEIGRNGRRHPMLKGAPERRNFGISRS